MIKLTLRALTKYLVGLLLVALLLFLPAGTLLYSNAWLFIALLFLPMLVLGTVLLIKKPELLEKRLDAKEKERTQKGVVGISALLFVAGFLVAGLDHRFAWSRVPTWLVILSSVILLISYALYAEVMRENVYLSRTVKVQKDQQVISTGLYGIVRHPMYATTVWLFLAIPLVLGSWFSLCCFLPYPLILALRIKNEEAVLVESLNGYDEYKRKVKYRLFPFIW